MGNETKSTNNQYSNKREWSSDADCPESNDCESSALSDPNGSELNGPLSSVELGAQYDVLDSSNRWCEGEVSR